MMTFEEMILLSPDQQKELFNRLGTQRKKGKVVNFSAQYGVGAKTLSLNSGLPIDECFALLKVYKKRNWAIEAVSETFLVKEVFNMKWIYNPVSKLWLELRSEKDRFSAVNQSCGVYVFDTFLGFCRKLGLVISMQMHDELLAYVGVDEIENTKLLLQKAIDKTNKVLKLNVEIGIDVKVGNNYSQTH